MSLAPIALFAYRRPNHILATLEALSRNPEAAMSTLHVFCDGVRDEPSDEERRAVARVRRIVRQERWCGRVLIHESSENLGLRASIRGGVSRILKDHERVIVLEDDIVTSPGFLSYMNQALDVYGQEEDVWHVSGYFPHVKGARNLPPTFFIPLMLCWGWATWRHAWDRARWDASDLLGELETHDSRSEFDVGTDGFFSGQLVRNVRGDMDTWAVMWYASIFFAGGLCLCPRKSLVTNIGMDGSGEHCTFPTSFASPDFPPAPHIPVRWQPPAVSPAAVRRVKRFYRYGPDATVVDIGKLALGSLKHRLARSIGLV